MTAVSEQSYISSDFFYFHFNVKSSLRYGLVDKAQHDANLFFLPIVLPRETTNLFSKEFSAFIWILAAYNSLLLLDYVQSNVIFWIQWLFY